MTKTSTELTYHDDADAVSASTETTLRVYPRISALIFDTPWAILPSKFEAICELIDKKASGIPVSWDGPTAQMGGTVREQRGSLAVVPLLGTLSHRSNLLSEFSGGTSTQLLGKQLAEINADPGIETVVFDVDSPGGQVSGIEELAAQIRDMSTRVVAQVNTMAASAAFWLASQADEIVMAPSGMAGSVGVIAQHVDHSAAEEKEGIKRTLVTAGDGKADMAQPINDESFMRLQSQVDRFFNRFVADVVDGRNAAFAARSDGIGAQIGAETVTGMWKAHMATSERALEIGMVDRIGTMEDTIGRELSRIQTAGDDRQRLRRGRRARLGV